MVTGVMLTPSAHALGQNDRFTNIGSIANTRHNMTQDTTIPSVSIDMDRYRNNYSEVCVYCHTPHAANQANGIINAPLWNRTIRATSYQTYNQLGTSTLTQQVSQPGPNSLTCLSCHDGQTAIDSIINMPGSGSAGATGAQITAQATTQSTAFLNLWTPPPGVTDATSHMGLNSTNGVMGDGTGTRGCLVCHSETGVLGGGLADFTLFNIGTDLRNDHPIGITFPAAAIAGTNNEDFNRPAGLTSQGGSNYFDENLDGKMQKNEIRTYDGKVECASCHDPHGVAPGVGLVFNPTFLRKKQAADVPTGPGAIGSRVCFTCHNK